MREFFCERPNLIPQLEVLEKRLPASHPKKGDMLVMLRRELAGIKGQNSLNFPLKFNHVTPPTIIHNLRLQDEDGFFELDTFILSGNFILILEVKNWYGILYIDEERQIIRVGDDGQEEGMPSPFSQAKIQKIRLKKWLDQQGFLVPVPILYNVVISFPSTILKPFLPQQKIPSEMIHSHQIPWKIQQLHEQYPLMQMDQNLIETMANTLHHHHRSKKMSALEMLSLTADDLMNGVFCPDCDYAPMEKIRAGWLCKQCGGLFPNAHLSALRDYQILFGNSITNKQARQFLNITSSYVTKRILQKACADSEGEKNKKVYFLNLL